MSKVRGVRFSSAEEELIEEFLRENKVLDFSTLAKLAILSFIRKPEFTLRPVNKPKKEGAKYV